MKKKGGEAQLIDKRSYILDPLQEKIIKNTQKIEKNKKLVLWFSPRREFCTLLSARGARNAITSVVR